MTTKTKQPAQTNLKSSIAELHKIYARANAVLFNNELPEDIVIVIQSRGKRKAYGWMYTQPIWKAGEEQTLFEIGIASETMDRPYFEIIQTLLHEMVHVHNVLNDVKDTSRGGTYHSKAFRDTCIERGFEYVANDGKPDSRIGYSQVTLTAETKNKIKFWSINKNAFSVSRMDTEGEAKKKKSNVIKWQCPSCADIVRSSKPDVNIICGNCMQPFEMA